VTEVLEGEAREPRDEMSFGMDLAAGVQQAEGLSGSRMNGALSGLRMDGALVLVQYDAYGYGGEVRRAGCAGRCERLLAFAVSFGQRGGDLTVVRDCY
jgi:hypothetical protein